MRKKIFKSGVSIGAFLTGLVLFLANAGHAAGTYLNSAHGNSATYGVKRSAAGFPADYPRGLCAHCHEQHANIDGKEPQPRTDADGDPANPSDFTLFSDNHTDQTTNFCYDCHKDAASYQLGGTILNRSYSYRAGGWTADTVNDILEAFSFSTPDTSHFLDDISTFITGRWNYTASSNPCAACHNPHAAQGDPANAPNSAKTAGTRGWPVSRPGLHTQNQNNNWGLWGDAVGEMMSDYTGGYQAPYRFNSTVVYEPDGSVTQNGSNLTDYVTFCTDCHDNVNIINSTPLSRNLYTFDWNVEKHGKGTADNNVPAGEQTMCTNIPILKIKAPYQVAQCGTYVLACTDCHEPHGSPNLFLVRKEVNGATVTVDTGTAVGPGPSTKPNTEWFFLCDNCHGIAAGDTTHNHPGTVPGGSAGCSSSTCHAPTGSDFRLCTDCHFHGNNLIDGTPYGDQLF